MYPVAQSTEAGHVELVINDQNDDGDNMVCANQDAITGKKVQCEHITMQAKT